MCKKITFSVIIPAYNSLKTIERSVQSVLNQSFKNFEILVVDDGSNKKTKNFQKKIFRKDKKIRLFSSSKNYGVSRSRNLAINKAKGDFIIFLDSDDYLLNDYLENIHKIIKRKNVELIIAPNKKIYGKLNDIQLYKQLFEKNKLSFFCWNYVLKRSFILKHKIFFENLKVFEDQLFVFKIFEKIKRYSFYKKKFIVRSETFQSLGRLTNHHSCYAYALIINRISNIISKTRDNTFLKYLKKKFFESINFFGLFSLICNNIQIIKYSKLIINANYFKKNFKVKDFNLIVKLFKNKNLHLFSTILKNKGFKKNDKINIYSLSLNSRILIDLLKIKKIKIDKIIDNNELFQGKIYKDIRILNRFKKCEINNKLVFIPFEFNYFFKKQKIYSIKKEKLIFFKFNKFSDFLFK